MDIPRASQVGALVLCLAIFAGANARGQGRPELQLNNRVATFTNLQGQVVAGASLIRADAEQVIYKTNDIYGTVKLTNLAPATLEMLGVTSSFLDQVRAQEKQQAAAAAQTAAIWKTEQERLKDPAGLFPMKVESVLSADYDNLFGKLQRCSIRATNGEAVTLWVARLPDSIPAYFQKQQSLVRDIARLTTQIETGVAQISAGAADLDAATAQLDQMEASLGMGVVLMPSVYYDGMFANPGFDMFSVPAARRSLNTASNQLADARNQVNDWSASRDAMRGQLEQMKAGEPAALTVFVLVSHFQHYGGQVLVCAPSQAAPAGQ